MWLQLAWFNWLNIVAFSVANFMSINDSIGLFVRINIKFMIKLILSIALYLSKSWTYMWINYAYLPKFYLTEIGLPLANTSHQPSSENLSQCIIIEIWCFTRMKFRIKKRRNILCIYTKKLKWLIESFEVLLYSHLVILIHAKKPF